MLGFERFLYFVKTPGYMAGALFSQHGSGNDFICLTDKPTWEDDNPGSFSRYGYIYGAEYYFEWPFKADNVNGG